MRSLVVVLFLICSGTAAAGNAWFYNLQVREVIVDDSKFGQCLMRLQNSVDIQSKLPECKPQYLTMDCGAELPGSSRTINNKKYEVGQISIVARRKVALLVTDDQTIDGYCYVKQARLL